MANEIVFVFPASRFMAYHTTLKNSQEFTAALLMARELAENITKSMRTIAGTSPDFEVFPYTCVLALATSLHLLFPTRQQFFRLFTLQWYFS